MLNKLLNISKKDEGGYTLKIERQWNNPGATSVAYEWLGYGIPEATPVGKAFGELKPTEFGNNNITSFFGYKVTNHNIDARKYIYYAEESKSSKIFTLLENNIGKTTKIKIYK